MSVTSVSSSTFDANLTDDDFDPVFALVSLMADLSVEFADYYEQAADELDTASDWLNWLGVATADDNEFDGVPDDEVVDFTAWMDAIGFNYTKYFKTSTTSAGEEKVTGFKGSNDQSGINELISVEVDSISTDATQAQLLTSGMIDDFGDATSELISLIDTLRSAGRGHIRS